MYVTPILSESISPLVPIVFFGAIGLGAVALVFVLLAGARRGPAEAPGQRSLGQSLGLAVGWIAMVIGALLILMLATTRGGAPRFMFVAAALPFLAGVRILQICRRRG